VTGSDTAGPRVGKTIREKTSLLPRSCLVCCHLAAVGVSSDTDRPPATGNGSVAGKGHSKNFGTYALADSFRAELLTAARQGQPFDATTGLPLSLLSQQEPERSWWEHACAFIDMKWPRVAPRSRQSIADALATVTPALLVAGSGRPPAAALREAMYGWAFNTGRRAAGGPPDHLTRTVAWLERHSLPLAALAAPRVARAALDTPWRPSSTARRPRPPRPPASVRSCSPRWSTRSSWATWRSTRSPG